MRKEEFVNIIRKHIRGQELLTSGFSIQHQEVYSRKSRREELFPTKGPQVDIKKLERLYEILAKYEIDLSQETILTVLHQMAKHPRVLVRLLNKYSMAKLVQKFPILQQEVVELNPTVAMQTTVQVHAPGPVPIPVQQTVQVQPPQPQPTQVVQVQPLPQPRVVTSGISLAEQVVKAEKIEREKKTEVREIKLESIDDEELLPYQCEDTQQTSSDSSEQTVAQDSDESLAIGLPFSEDTDDTGFLGDEDEATDEQKKIVTGFLKDSAPVKKELPTKKSIQQTALLTKTVGGLWEKFGGETLPKGARVVFPDNKQVRIADSLARLLSVKDNACCAVALLDKSLFKDEKQDTRLLIGYNTVDKGTKHQLGLYAQVKLKLINDFLAACTVIDAKQDVAPVKAKMKYAEAMKFAGKIKGLNTALTGSDDEVIYRLTKDLLKVAARLKKLPDVVEYLICDEEKTELTSTKILKKHGEQLVMCRIDDLFNKSMLKSGDIIIGCEKLNCAKCESVIQYFYAEKKQTFLTRGYSRVDFPNVYDSSAELVKTQHEKYAMAYSCVSVFSQSKSVGQSSPSNLHPDDSDSELDDIFDGALKTFSQRG